MDEGSKRLLACASLLFTLANEALDSGDAAYADQLTARAVEYLDRAIPIEKPITQRQQKPESKLGTSCLAGGALFRPLLQHSRPLPDGQPYPRPPFGFSGEDCPCLVRVEMNPQADGRTPPGGLPCLVACGLEGREPPGRRPHLAAGPVAKKWPLSHKLRLWFGVCDSVLPVTFIRPVP
jgi:hypothetical protein